MNFANIRNEQLIDMNSKYLDTDIVRVEVTDEIYNAYLEDRNKVIYSDGAVILNPNYEAEQEQKEKERIAKLTCTKRVFALMLQELGITYTMLKQLIATNEQAQLEWDLCVELERQNPLLDVMALQLGITSEQLDGLFMYANGEITIEQFREMYIIPEPVVDNPEEVEEENPVITETETDEV